MEERRDACGHQARQGHCQRNQWLNSALHDERERDTLFFRANDGVNGEELWQSDRTSAGTTLVKDISSGISNSNPSFLTNVNGTLFFDASGCGSGVELWQSDGTSAGTTLVKDIRSGRGGSFPQYAYE